MARTMKLSKFVDRSTRRVSLFAIPILAIAGIAGITAPRAVFAQQADEKTFATPGDGVLLLYNAVKSGDQAAMAALFGSNSSSILHTGDEVADKTMGDNFILRYDEMHRVVEEPDGTVTLYVGAENWPLPIPITKNSSGAWYFDTAAGKTEILRRRVGTNENDAIEVLYGLVDAQRDYHSELRNGEKIKQYAQKFLSDDGKQNGLYWKTSDTEPPSPIGPLLGDAATQGYSAPEKGKNTPFHGYYFRMITKQGAAAKGGALDYVVGGKVTRGFAFVAYPAAYRNSGVMTFIVDQNGAIYEKDLGAETETLADAMDTFNPDDTWYHIE